LAVLKETGFDLSTLPPVNRCMPAYIPK
jgi:hypothetical protein